MRTLTIYSLFAVLLGCGADTSRQQPDAMTFPESDAKGEHLDGSIDAAPDATPDASPDAGPDASPDATPDASSDGAIPDADPPVKFDGGSPDAPSADAETPDGRESESESEAEAEAESESESEAESESEGEPTCTDPLGCWRAITLEDAPLARERHTAVWTGSEMIVWGGYNGLCGNEIGTGGLYDPATDAWASVSTDDAPSARINHTAVWTGSDMIVWGGWTCEPIAEFGDGAAYDPVTDTWVPLPAEGVPTPRYNHTAVWTGSEMIVWGGRNSVRLADGGCYDPETVVWNPIVATEIPARRDGHAAKWIGSRMVVWGGIAWEPTPVYSRNGGQYSCSDGVWTATSTSETLAGRVQFTSVWTGSRMIMWGGTGEVIFGDGGQYDPEGDVWEEISLTAAPSARMLHTAVWTGSEMIVWGGATPTITGDGGRYDPEADAWESTSMDGAPTARDSHTAVWTGSEMCVWGGGCAGAPCADGACYTPPGP